MGIVRVEDNSKLALRAHGSPNRGIEECLPAELIAGTTNWFLKSGKRDYDLKNDIPLLETRGDEKFSDPLALIRVLEETHFLTEGEEWTRGKYEIKEVYKIDR